MVGDKTISRAAGFVTNGEEIIVNVKNNTTADMILTILSQRV